MYSTGSEKKVRLGVNVDHIATLREARKTSYPDPVEAALQAQSAGADGITVHLREDRRHIQEKDVILLKEKLSIPLNLEMAVTREMIEFAVRLKPEKCCLVPEKRQELTTEGGLDVVGQKQWIRQACQELNQAGIEVSLFIDPDVEQINASVACGAPVVELHTGTYAEALDHTLHLEYERIKRAVEYAQANHLIVNAGHGLNYENVKKIAAIPDLYELNIGHSIVAYALSWGLSKAVEEMKHLILEARQS